MLLSSRDIYDLSKKLHYASKFNSLLDNVISKRKDGNTSDIHVSIITKKHMIVNDINFNYRGYNVIITKHESNYIDNNKAVIICNELLPTPLDYKDEE